MQAWSFDLAEHAQLPATIAWRQTLARLSLPDSEPLADTRGMAGRVRQVITPLGIEITRLEGAPQRISGRYRAQSDGIWLAQLLSETGPTGSATLAADGVSRKLPVGAIGFGPLAEDAVLTLPHPFSLLYVRLPKLALHPRLLAPARLRVGVLEGGLGVRHVLAGFLRALGESLDGLDNPQLRPIELALSELLIGAVLADPAADGAPVSRQGATLHRLCQIIESELGDPDLTMTAIAAKGGVSPRHLQKLFAQNGQNFSQYVRERRLDRCRSDLASPLSAHLSISEICFRWGFNDAAHFSRSFRAAYGTSPREWRREQVVLS